MISDAAPTSLRRVLGSREFWNQRALHPVARILLIVVVSVLLCIAVGFIITAGHFARADLLALMLYAAIAAYAWHPLTAAFMVMVICSLGAVLTGSGGDLLELAIALGLVAATCAPWVIGLHVLVLSALTADIALNGSSLTDGGVYGIAGIAMIAFLAGLAFRIVTAREAILVAERARVVTDLEALAREEQERIADALHDGIAHDLTLVLFHARALPRQPDEAARQVSLTTIEDSAENALQSVQSLLSLMRETRPEGAEACPTRYDGDAAQTATSLGMLLSEAGIPTRVLAPEALHSATPAVGRVLAETAIEAVTNILKHAPSSQSASIKISDGPDIVELVVNNKAGLAVGATRASGGGRGLPRARQRLALCGGRLESGSTADGWELRATVPTHHPQK
ncbi:sensor histidine kinase [Yonghaparkia sp. Root332]|uniref:sensor histidine kinase n=1 Tax=Yonghaparkia sp. Root332 TaxID=1736516 RepID=UPI0009E9D8FA|nr:histidine kinase [Yonghaparkia sp. Root332]